MSQETLRYTVLPRVLIFVFRGDELLLMKYSGKGGHMTQEKADRKNIYNCIGGHVEQGEDVIEGAIKEAKEEAGIELLDPKVKGIINVSGFAGKNIMNFIIAGTTDDTPLASTEEGSLEWVKRDKVKELNIFPDLIPILGELFALKDDEMFVGKAVFDGKFKLESIDFQRV